jgi:hypothetical protein
MFLVDTEQGRLVGRGNQAGLAARRHAGGFASADDAGPAAAAAALAPGRAGVDRPAAAEFGYTEEDLKFILEPMARDGQEPLGSMGVDTPLACLSDKPQPLFHYFRQLFAQVTNPPIDPIREELVMSLTSYIGTERNILDETPLHCHTLKLAPDPDQLRPGEAAPRFLATSSPRCRHCIAWRGNGSGPQRICRRASLAIRTATPC